MAKENKKKRVLVTCLAVVLALVVLLVGGGWYFFYDLTWGPLPQHDGEMRVAGLRDTVEVFRDEWGIPHIYAQNMYDLYFAQGFVQAQDRWWQMEFWRHTASGRIQELTGKKASLMPTDIFIRSVGWRHVAEEEAESYDAECLSNLQAFADGVNAYIMSRELKHLALEYGVLGLIGIDIKVEPWTPADSLSWAKVMAWDLGPSNSGEEKRSTMYELVGKEMTNKWAPPWPFGKKPTILQLDELGMTDVPQAERVNDAIDDAKVETAVLQDILPDVGFGFGSGRAVGSNNWVIGGNTTKSGMPLLANDPHLGIQMPSIWYAIGLHCKPIDGSPPFDVTGFALSSSPGVIIGHNSHIAWGVTNVNPDVFDLYRIKVNPANPLQYEWNGAWRDIKVRQETINFGDGQSPVTIQVRETHLGPIINDNKVDKETGEIQGFNNKDPMALHWTALESGTILKAVTGLNEATNWEEFREALKYWDVPSQNFVYADVKGNVGYQTPGRIPIRAKHHSGLLPVPGWTNEFEWQGFIPFDKLPTVFNPKRGYVATANQAVVPLEYYDMLASELGEGENYAISQEWDYGYRGQRIIELLEKLAPHSIETLQVLQGDNKLISAEELIPYLGRLRFNEPELNEARDWLMKWDYQFDMDSPQAALYAEFWMQLANNLFGDQLPEQIKLEGWVREMWAAYLLMEQPNDTWWDDASTSDVVETRDDILVRSFREGYNNAVATLGNDRSRWRWGNLHTSTFVSNPLGRSGVSFIEKMVNRGPYPTSGCTGTVNNTRWTVHSGSFAVDHLPSMRMIVDLGDLTRSVAIHTTGQSGHPYSKHYDDMIELWRNIKYHPMLWTRAQVEAAAANKLILKPAN